MKTANEILAFNLRRLRKIADLSQEALAEKAGISWAHYQQCETGNSWPTPALLAKIAKALKVQEVEFFKDPNEKPPPPESVIIEFGQLLARASPQALKYALEILKTEPSEGSPALSRNVKRSLPSKS